MKEFESKLKNTNPRDPEVTARVIELIQSLTPEEAQAFLEYRKPGMPKYWFGEPIPKTRPKRGKAKTEQESQG